MIGTLRSSRAFMLALCLTACGGREELRPVAGETLLSKPYAADTTPTPSELMTPEAQARPRRSDELLRKSEERRDDRFDLPPPN